MTRTNTTQSAVRVMSTTTTSSSTTEDCFIVTNDNAQNDLASISLDDSDSKNDELMEIGSVDVKLWKAFDLNLCQWPRTRYITHVERKGFNDICRPRSFYELHDGCFMLVQSILRDHQHQYLLVGQIFTRAEATGPEAPIRRNVVEWPTNQHGDVRSNTQMPHIYYNELIWQVRVAYKEDKQDYGL